MGSTASYEMIRFWNLVFIVYTFTNFIVSQDPVSALQFYAFVVTACLLVNDYSKEL